MKPLNMKKIFQATGLAMAISLVPAFSISTSASAAGLQSQMDKLFGDMSNVTGPGAYKTQRRGVLTGGRITQKSKIFNENLISFSPPSWKAGCGGVDLFTGSLSFINGDQIVQLLRQVAANAKGYAFQLALDNVFPDGAKWIESFQKKVQALNQFLGNSCQLAQGLINDHSNLLPFDAKTKTDASLTASAKGFMNDFFESREQTTGKSATKALEEQAPEELREMTGNVTWKQLRENEAKTWFPEGDALLLESILSLTGSVIVGTPKSDGSGDDSMDLHFVPGNLITLTDLVFGGSVEIYDCSINGDTSECAGSDGVISKKKTVITGYATRLNDLLKGSDSSVGIIGKYANHKDHTGFSEDEKNLLEVLPGGVGGVLRNLSALSPSAADLFVSEVSAALAIDMVYHLVDGLFRSANIALANSKSNYKSQAIQELAKSRTIVREEYATLQGTYGNIISLMERYNSLISNVRKQKYITSTLSKPAQKGAN